MINPLNSPTPGDHGYIAMYNGKRIELYAKSSYAAHVMAVNYFEPPKSKRHMVHVHLADEDES